MKRARRLNFPLRSVGPMQRPIWRGLEAAIAWQIEIGRVPAGSRVPSTRALARQIGVSRNTVAQAFDSLVAQGYLAARTGDGTYVLAQRHRPRPAVWQWRRQWIRDPEGLLLWISNGSLHRASPALSPASRSREITRRLLR